MLNRGTAFTVPERRALRLTGLLPGGVTTLASQLRRVHAQYARQPGDLAAPPRWGNPPACASLRRPSSYGPIRRGS